jgi:hypothetical protein
MIYGVDFRCVLCFELDPLERVPGPIVVGSGPTRAKTKIIVVILSLCAFEKGIRDFFEVCIRQEIVTLVPPMPGSRVYPSNGEYTGPSVAELWDVILRFLRGHLGVLPWRRLIYSVNRLVQLPLNACPDEASAHHERGWLRAHRHPEVGGLWNLTMRKQYVGLDMGLSGFQIWPVSGTESDDFGGLSGRERLQNPSKRVGRFAPHHLDGF